MCTATATYVGAVAETILVPILVLTLGTKSKSELDDRSWTGFLTELRNECKGDGCLHESAGEILKLIRYRTGCQCSDFGRGIERVKCGYLVATVAKQLRTRCNFVTSSRKRGIYNRPVY